MPQYGGSGDARNELTSRTSRGFTPTTTQADPTSRPAPNVLDQDFTATAPNRKWVTDITSPATARGWVYLAFVLDLFRRKVVGWALSHSLMTELVSAALRQAVQTRRPTGRDLLHYSDRGCPYNSHEYQDTLQTLGLQYSMSPTRYCYDNAVMERFFWSLNHEWTDHESFRNLEDARRSIPATSNRLTIPGVSTRCSTTCHQISSKPLTPRHLWRKTTP